MESIKKEILSKYEIKKFLTNIEQLSKNIKQLKDNFLQGKYTSRNELIKGLEVAITEKIVVDLKL